MLLLGVTAPFRKNIIACVFLGLGNRPLEVDQRSIDARSLLIFSTSASTSFIDPETYSCRSSATTAFFQMDGKHLASMIALKTWSTTGIMIGLSSLINVIGIPSLPAADVWISNIVLATSRPFVSRKAKASGLGFPPGSGSWSFMVEVGVVAME